MSTLPSKVLVIGSGPIVIGQAAEFDYAGTQACKSLREEGIKTILVNSNPATIMTDQETADVVYIEPLTKAFLEKIIDIERPDGLLATLGGQTGLNLAVELSESGILEKYNVQLLGTQIEAIQKAEDRELFRQLLHEINEPEPPNVTVDSVKNAIEVADSIGYPLIARPAYTLGGTGGGIINNENELESVIQSGLNASPINQVLLEKSLIGWKEVEYEVMRDGNDTCITICNMENLDPMGVHTGDSIVVAPSQTLSDKEYQTLRTASIKIIRALGIEGGCNVQLALAPHQEIAAELAKNSRPTKEIDYYVIEVNPRVSRSSALASKATGYPIARVAAKIAIGKKLNEIQNSVTGQTVAAFEPALDYCVVKIPRWPFDKFPSGNRQINTQMKATGEVMAIDRSFESALQKAIRSLEQTETSLLWEDPDWKSIDSWQELPLFPPTDQRIWALAAALRRGASVEEISKKTFIDFWFIQSIKNITDIEKYVMENPETSIDSKFLLYAKRMGYSDVQLANLGIAEGLAEHVRNLRKSMGITPVYKMVDTCAGEFESITSYYYSTYEEENEALPLPEPKAIVIGSGPIRIGQGIEFDYCSVHAASSLREQGRQSIIVNSNPETVSTDFDSSDRLYFEPLDEESLRDIIDNETNSTSNFLPESVVQFGGQTSINLSQKLNNVELPILGSTAQVIDIASDRKKFEEFASRNGLPQPPGATVTNLKEAITVAENIGYPVLVRPSYVLGGRAMEIVYNIFELEKYIEQGLIASPDRPILIDKYFEGIECEVDAVCDGETVVIPGIMEHIERTGVHSGDSMAVYPTQTISQQIIDEITSYTIKIGLGLEIKGLMNIQYIIMRNENTPKVYIIEVNPRASRTIPFISKVTDTPMVKLASGIMIGKKLRSMGYTSGLLSSKPLVAIKAPVFSMAKLSGVDTHLGPEMKSTGEVMGIDKTYENALAKALIASGLMLKQNGSILLSIADRDKKDSENLINDLIASNYIIYATEGTANFIRSLGYDDIKEVSKLDQGNPNVLDLILNANVDCVINTLSGGEQPMRDGFYIRRAAVEQRIPCFTSMDTARTAVSIMHAKIDDQGYTIRPQINYLMN
ncbi:MAG: carbamoyl phosphate synthase large subunit [Chloroflexi bacterium]|nr:carbamoyl phosphate synthase large subunit [Chloroflexota bacterium]|tara:strand:- start:10564 stop:13860 length:3297 start_codon:yes stop_codon:yes gene_type:complete